MSEPHELMLEKIVTREMCGPEDCSYPQCLVDCPNDSVCPLIGKDARAVLALVRHEQEKDATHEMADRGESSLICGPDPGDLEDSPSMSWAHARSCYRAMIRAWWLSHTAPQEK